MEPIKEVKSILGLEESYALEGLITIFNESTKHYEILREMKMPDKKNSMVKKYQNQKGEVIKIISKNNRLLVKPKRYNTSSIKPLNRIVMMPKSIYGLQELNELEVNVNNEFPKIKIRKKSFKRIP